MLTVLEPLATAFEVTPQAIALAWLLQHPAGILPVVGTTKSENLEAAQKALNIKLDRQQWYTIYQAATGTTLP
jgi:predicted oxidoreductase